MTKKYTYQHWIGFNHFILGTNVKLVYVIGLNYKLLIIV